MHEYFEVADNCLFQIIKEKHYQIQDAFASLGNLMDDVLVAFSHINAMRIISRDLQQKVRKDVVKVYLLRRKQRRRKEALEILNALHEMKNGMKTIEQCLDKVDVVVGLEIFLKLSEIFETKLSKIRVAMYDLLSVYHNRQLKKDFVKYKERLKGMFITQLEQVLTTIITSKFYIDHKAHDLVSADTLEYIVVLFRYKC